MGEEIKEEVCEERIRVRMGEAILADSNFKFSF